jgi:hypothetical protein
MNLMSSTLLTEDTEGIAVRWREPARENGVAWPGHPVVLP